MIREFDDVVLICLCMYIWVYRFGRICGRICVLSEIFVFDCEECGGG